MCCNCTVFNFIAIAKCWGEKACMHGYELYTIGGLDYWTNPKFHETPFSVRTSKRPYSAYWFCFLACCGIYPRSKVTCIFNELLGSVPALSVHNLYQLFLMRSHAFVGKETSSNFNCQ